jgi:hypothetical protein
MLCSYPFQMNASLLIPSGSLIICTVAYGEYFPFVIQSLWDAKDPWLAPLVSAFVLAVFAEILPQYFIPRQAIIWAIIVGPSSGVACGLQSSLAGHLPGFSMELLARKTSMGSLRTSNLLFSSNVTSGPRSMVVCLDLMPHVSCLGRWISMVVELVACILSPTSASSSEPPQIAKFSQGIYDSMSELSWAA